MGVAGHNSRPVTGVILAGGESRRFDYVNKAFFKIHGEAIVERVYKVMRTVFDDHIIVVTNTPADYLKWDVRIVTDIFSCRSSMTGIHAGLFFTETPYIFACGCDTPFLKKELIEIVLAGLEKTVDIVVPRTANGFEPLCAVYSRSCLQAMEKCLTQKTYDIKRIFEDVRVKSLGEEILRQGDPDLSSFINVNTPEELRRAREIAGDRSGDESR